MADPILLDLPTTLDTERLHLRHPRAGDGPAVCEALRESLPALRRFLASLPWVADEPSPERSEAWARNCAANVLARRDFPFLLFERDGSALVGACGLHRPEWTTPKIEVGYWVRSPRAGRGYVTEAVRAVGAFAFERLRVARLELISDAANAESRRVAERCGFTLEGVLRHERRAPDGTLRDTCVYARLAPSAAG